LTLSTDPWQLPEVPVLSRSAHDRIAHRRDDDGWLARAWQNPSSQVLVVSADGTAALRPDADRPRLTFRAPSEVQGIAGVRVLLGEADGLVYFALLAAEQVAEPDWASLRALATDLSDLDVGLLTAAVALQAWHQRHPRCPRCGAATEPAQASWSRRCSVDSSVHFPRTDPAVIMLVHDGAGRCVLARGPQWAPGRMSVLAGFVEAGESAEAAVAREVAEEVGVQVRDVRYIASQPHPFPASLMLGFTARLAGDAMLRIDDEEIAEAGWFTRDDVRRASDWGDEGASSVPEGALLRALPPRMSIARQLLQMWLETSD